MVFFIGMFDNGDYAEKTTKIEDGDAILLYTDCILEAEDKEGKQFGKTRLKDLFLKAIKQSHGQDVITQIETQVRSFNVRDSFDDDFTALLLEL